MADKITNFLAKLERKDKEKCLAIISQVIQKDTQGLDIKKIVGYDNKYRVRAGNIRIVFDILGDRVCISAIDFRGNIYKDL